MSKKNPPKEAILYKPEKTITIIPRGRKFTLKELQYYVEGYIEILDLANSCLIVNENGKINDMVYNIKASQKFGIDLYGPIIHCKRNLI